MTKVMFSFGAASNLQEKGCAPSIFSRPEAASNLSLNEPQHTGNILFFCFR